MADLIHEFSSPVRGYAAREAVAYWASGLEPIYLEGALRRAIGSRG